MIQIYTAGVVSGLAHAGNGHVIAAQRIELDTYKSTYTESIVPRIDGKRYGGCSRRNETKKNGAICYNIVLGKPLLRKPDGMRWMQRLSEPRRSAAECRRYRDRITRKDRSVAPVRIRKLKPITTEYTFIVHLYLYSMWTASFQAVRRQRCAASDGNQDDVCSGY